MWRRASSSTKHSTNLQQLLKHVNKKQQQQQINGSAKRKTPHPFQASKKQKQEEKLEIPNHFLCELSEEQKRCVCETVESCSSVLISGPAGTGKTRVIKTLCDLFSHLKFSFAVTASTGIAATNIGGISLAAWMGFVRKQGQSLAVIINKMLRKQVVKKRWVETQRLIIEECSMITGTTLLDLDKVARQIRQIDEPFGGIQVILVGDFLQLPPVCAGEQAKYMFELAEWDKLIIKKYFLTHPFRQSDPHFFELLQRVRQGQPNLNDDKLLQGLVIQSSTAGSSAPTTVLYGTKAKVQNLNMKNLSLLEPDEAKWLNFKARSSIIEPPLGKKAVGDKKFLQDFLDNCRQNCLAPESLSLVKGAQVMCIANIGAPLDYTICNGSQGIVIDFDCVNSEWYPIVEFSCVTQQSRDEKIIKRITPFTWSCESGNYKANYSQIPLTLAYALTVHKAQGMTLDRVQLDFDSLFSPQQAYVGLSRVRTLAGLQLLSFNSQKIYCDLAPRRFYSS